MWLHFGSHEPATEYRLGRERSMLAEAKRTIGSGRWSELA
jgi:hypothetical protein